MPPAEVPASVIVLPVPRLSSRSSSFIYYTGKSQAESRETGGMGDTQHRDTHIATFIDLWKTKDRDHPIGIHQHQLIPPTCHCHWAKYVLTQWITKYSKKCINYEIHSQNSLLFYFSILGTLNCCDQRWRPALFLVDLLECLFCTAKNCYWNLLIVGGINDTSRPLLLHVNSLTVPTLLVFSINKQRKPYSTADFIITEFWGEREDWTRDPLEMQKEKNAFRLYFEKSDIFDWKVRRWSSEGLRFTRKKNKSLNQKFWSSVPSAAQKKTFRALTLIALSGLPLNSSLVFQSQNTEPSYFR